MSFLVVAYSVTRNVPAWWTPDVGASLSLRAAGTRAPSPFWPAGSGLDGWSGSCPVHNLVLSTRKKSQWWSLVITIIIYSAMHPCVCVLVHFIKVPWGWSWFVSCSVSWVFPQWVWREASSGPAGWTERHVSWTASCCCPHPRQRTPPRWHGSGSFSCVGAHSPSTPGKVFGETQMGGFFFIKEKLNKNDSTKSEFIYVWVFSPVWNMYKGVCAELSVSNYTRWSKTSALNGHTLLPTHMWVCYPYTKHSKLNNTDAQTHIWKVTCS